MTFKFVVCAPPTFSDKSHWMIISSYRNGKSERHQIREKRKVFNLFLKQPIESSGQHRSSGSKIPDSGRRMEEAARTECWAAHIPDLLSQVPAIVFMLTMPELFSLAVPFNRVFHQFGTLSLITWLIFHNRLILLKIFFYNQSNHSLNTHLTIRFHWHVMCHQLFNVHYNYCYHYYYFELNSWSPDCFNNYFSGMAFLKRYGPKIVQQSFSGMAVLKQYGDRNSTTAEEVSKIQHLFPNPQLADPENSIWSPKTLPIPINRQLPVD